MPRLHLLRTGLLISLLALAGQLAFGATVPEFGLARGPAICHAGAGHEKPVPSRQHDRGCVLCPLCATLMAPSPTLVPPPVLPTPPILATEPAATPPFAAARVPMVASAAQPRGPPSLA